MDILCEHCGVRLNIPDEKIPKGQRVSLTCPKCKNRMVLETGQPDADLPEANEAISQAWGEAPSLAPCELAMAYFEGGGRLALLVGENDPSAGKIATVVEDMGFKSIKIGNVNAAVARLRLRPFDLVIWWDDFQDRDRETHPLFHYLDHLASSMRRRMFLCLVGDSFKTLDPMMAFAMSANLIVNRADQDRFGAILRHALAEHAMFYRAFIETLEETGRA